MKLKRIISKIKLLPSYQLAYFILIVILFIVYNFDYDNDFWFTINQGKYVLEHGFPTVAINSIHNLDFIYQSWGTGTLFYLIYNYLGLYGMISLLIIVIALTMYFFYKLCFVVSNNKRASLIITLIALLLYSFFIVTRPHIFTVLNLVIMLYLLESYIKTDNTKYLYFLPLVSLLEINMHGVYFSLLLIILTPYLINSFKFKIFNIKSNGYRNKPLFITFLCMLLTGFINPYGYKTIIYGFKSYFISSVYNNSIIELMAPNFHIFLGRVSLIAIIIIFAIYFTKIKDKPIRYTLLLLGTTYLALDAQKSFYLFLFCSIFSLSMIYKKRDNIDNLYSKKYHIIHLVLTIVLCISILFLIKKPSEPDIKLFMDYLDENVSNKEEMKLFTDYFDGSYAEYRGYYCYLDPRGEIFFKVNNNYANIYEEFDDVDNLRINYKDFIDKYKFDYMLVKNNSSLGYLLKDNSYKYSNVLENENHTLYKIKEEK